VYVDSGSTDDSVDFARQRGVNVVQLDMTVPFTAARARNAGAAELMRVRPDIRYIQFVDGDCVVREQWIAAAAKYLDDHDTVGIVCGRRRERHPDASIYNRLCDLEWDTPIGAAKACGGDFMIRRDAFEKVGGLNPSLIAGEEPELCVRVRQAGWSIERLDEEMTLHDAAMTRFGQWWKRCVRAGHAFAEGAWMHGRPPERHGVKAVRSALMWAFVLPALIIAGLFVVGPWALLLLLAYPLLWARVYLYQRRFSRSPRDARLYALFIVLGKFAELCGIGLFLRRKLLRQRSTLIEYKQTATPSAEQSG
jgi:GT2 family glycosyltransferase